MVSTRKLLYAIGFGAIIVAVLAAAALIALPKAHADPYCFVPIGQYKNTCDPTYLWPQTSGENGIPGTFGPDGGYTPRIDSVPPYVPNFGSVLR